MNGYLPPEERPKRERLDMRVVREIPQLSRAFGVKLILGGQVQVNGEVVDKPGHKLWPTDTVAIDYDVTELEKIPDIELPILYEDDDCVVIDKPLGLLVHTKGALLPEATVATWLRKRTHDMTGERAGIVHRLDRATSGVLMCAKHPAALKFLQKQFEQRTVEKTYTAVVEGLLKEPEAIIDLPIERNPKAPATFRVGAQGKHAVTRYKVLENGANKSLVELYPKTGRTHQLRVHMAHLGCPIVGDELYGQKAIRLYLHAHSLTLTLPSGDKKTFTSPVPPSFKKEVKS